MSKSIMALISICLLLLAPLSVASTSANSEATLVTKKLWSTLINGTALTSQTVPDVNDDGHEDVLVASKTEDGGGGYLTLINGKNGLTIRKISLDYEPTEVLCVPKSDRIAVAKKTGGVGVYDMQLNLNFSIPTYHSWGGVYQNGSFRFYWLGIWTKNQSDYGINPPEMYPLNPMLEMLGYNHTEQWGYIGEIAVEYMNYTANLPPPSTWNPWPYMLDVKLNKTPAPYEYAPKHLNTFDGTDIVYTEGYYVDVANSTDISSYSLTNCSLNWRSGGIFVPLTSEGLYPHYPLGMCIFGSIFGITDLVVLSPTRAVGHMRTMGVEGINFSNPSHLGEWPLILIDKNGGKVEQYTIYHKMKNKYPGIGIGTYCWHMTCVENATYERHFVSPITPYDQSNFLITVTGFEASVLYRYSIAYDNFTIVWKTPIDRGDMNRGFLIEDLNDDGEKEILAVLDGNVTVFSGSDGAKLYGTDLSTFVIVDVAHLSLGDVILTAEGEGCLLSFGSSNHTTYWKQFLGPAWETFISPMQDVDGDDRTDLAVAVGNNVTCYWGYYETYIPPPPPPLPIQNQWWFWLAIAIAADAFVIGLVGLARRHALRKEAALTA